MLGRRGLAVLAVVCVGVALFRVVDGWVGRGISPSPPATLPDAPLPDDQAVSVLDVPVRIDLERLTELVEQEIPREWVREGLRVGDDGPAASIALTRGPISGSYTSGVASLSLTVTYALRTSVSIPVLPDLRVSCGVDTDAPPRMDVRVESPLSLTPEWSLRARTRVAHVGPSTSTDRDRCEVTALRIDATESVSEGMRGYLTEHTPSIDSVIATIDVRSSFERWWSVLSNPVRLNESTWLELRPQGIASGPVMGFGSSVEVHGHLSARPRLHFGRPPPPDPMPLPSLTSAGSSDQSFEAVVDAVADYGEVSAVLTSLLGDTELEGVGRRISIERVAVSGLGANRVAVELQIGGDLSGRLYFVGTPAFSQEDLSVSLPDLTMSVATSDLLVIGASWVLDSGLEVILRERARWPVDVGVDWARARLEDGLNATLEQGLRLRGALGDLQILEVHARRDGLLVRARVSGRVELLVEAL